MKSNISRQSVYILALSVLLLVFVLVFAFAFLIPEGKEYRIKRAELRKEQLELRKYESFRDEILERLNKLQSDNRNIIEAFDREFDPERFEKIHQASFKSLTLRPSVQQENEGRFTVYEVNTTSRIDSPTSFYQFLDALNKSDWIVGVNFPIQFKREDEMIRSSFTIRVYAIEEEESNATK